ncbi:MAG: N-acetyltransferase family protein [Gemmatimonadota bacterium]
MEIRRAEPRDLEGIVDVHTRSSLAAYAELPAPASAVTPDARRRQWQAALAEAEACVWVAVEAGAIIGFCHLRLPAAPASAGESAEITTLYIVPELWRQGVGRALVNHARGTAASHGCSRIFLKVYAENASARAAYEAMGFAATAGTSVHQRTGLLLREYELVLG